MAFLRDAIKQFNARPTGAFGTNAVVANLIGLPGAQWRITHGSIPGTTLDFGLIEYSGVPRTKVLAGAEDPGSPAFTMVVRDVNAAVEQWTKAGGTLATTGGKSNCAREWSGQCVRTRCQRFDVGVDSAGGPIDYFPTMCAGSRLFSSQMLSIRSVSGTRRQAKWTVQGFV